MRLKYFTGILLVIFPLNCFFATTSVATESKAIQKGNNAKVTMASIDTEHLFNKLSEELNLREKIMREYNDFLKNQVPSKLSLSAKENLITDEMDKIMIHYSNQVAGAISQIINQLIKERSLTVVLNKKTFSIREAIVSPKQQRNNIIERSKRENEDFKSFKEQKQTAYYYENYYNQSVLSSAFDLVDLTSEASKMVDKMIPNIKILSYRRSLR